MPNYNLVINSTFQPFSFEEMLQPVMIAQAAHREVEDAYSELSTKAGEFEALAESERLRNGDTSETYKRYSSYARDLKAQVDSLMKEGLTSSSRNRMIELKRRYATDIDPIEKTSERLKYLMDERRKQEMANPTVRYERGYNEVGIDELLLNPNLTYGKSYSGALIEQQAAVAASALAKNMREDPKGWQKVLGNQYYQRKIQRGYTPEEVLLASLGDPNAPKELQEIMTKAITTSGIESWEGYFDDRGNITQRGQSILSDVRSFAGRGLNTAVGGTEYERVSNKAYDYAMQAALRGIGGGGRTGKVTPPKGNKNPKMDVAVSKENEEKAKKLATLKQLDSKNTTKTTWRPATTIELLSHHFSQNDNNTPTPLLNAVDKTPRYGVDFSATRKETSFVNPVEEYEKAQEYKATTSTVSPTSTVRFNSMITNDPYLPSYGPTEYSRNNNNTLITQDQYEALKELGYDSNSTAEDFSQLQQRLDEAIKQASPISINLSNYDREEEALARKLSADTMAGNVYEYTGDGKLIKDASYDDIFKVDNSGTISFKNSAEFGVDPNNLDYLVLQTGGKSYSVRATLLFPEIKDILDKLNVREYYEMGDQDVKDDIVQSLSFIYQDLMNNYDPRMPATSSQATYGYPY